MKRYQTEQSMHPETTKKITKPALSNV